MKIYDLRKKNKFDDCELTDLLSSGKVPFKIIYDGNIEKDKLIMLLEKYNYVYQQQYDYKNNLKYILVTECVWTSNENNKKEIRA